MDVRFASVADSVQEFARRAATVSLAIKENGFFFDKAYDVSEICRPARAWPSENPERL
jgi:hypothetical protein